MGWNQFPKITFVIPNHSTRGLENHADADPVSAKTSSTSTSFKFDSIPQRCFNFRICHK